jgi:hypothetical protein
MKTSSNISGASLRQKNSCTKSGLTATDLRSTQGESTKADALV